MAFWNRYKQGVIMKKKLKKNCLNCVHLKLVNGYGEPYMWCGKFGKSDTVRSQKLKSSRMATLSYREKAKRCCVLKESSNE